MPKTNRTCIRIFKEIEDLLEGENKMGKRVPTIKEIREAFERMKEKRPLILNGVKIKPSRSLIKRFERIRKMSEEQEEMENENKNLLDEKEENDEEEWG
jgi:uncharacterized coiled-coil DUF342 family protein